MWYGNNLLLREELTTRPFGWQCSGYVIDNQRHSVFKIIGGAGLPSSINTCHHNDFHGNAVKGGCYVHVLLS